MDYSLENLGPERFQEICHALLCKTFPSTQCFPVGQRDGGRDAVSYGVPHSSREIVVYQVKFVRNPLAEQEPHKWLAKKIENEAPKVKALIPKGATKYCLLTNVPGTAYPESGAIDSVQRILEDQLPIPAQCWWRNDINRRLDDAWDIKWSYPDILSGPDILRLVIENAISEDAARRTAAVRACVRDQFNRDQEVRFKQVELQNELLNLFIDVPVTVPDSRSESSRKQQTDFAVLRAVALEARIEASGRDRVHRENLTVGAASLLLHHFAQRHLDRIVIEGAPGQGKSTIVQYVCQIHRRRILGEAINDPRIPSAHRTSPVRLPLKIDCRDFALWLNRHDPFAADESASPPDQWQASLESFLARQVVHHSGGASFTVADLHAVAGPIAVLLVFDGLDEVADLGRRRAVVDEISRGLGRLKDNCASIQAIVTSRPAVLSDSPGLPETDFTYLHLSSIDRQLIDEYAEKWMKARRLEGREASDVRRVLRVKLDQPHLRELARNPMQLAILLSLIQTRGGSLPDKRTALYDSYVDRFFSREAEKSVVVRDHRDLLIDIHRYIAWVLHAEAQAKQTAGSATTERLGNLVEAYLKDEGQDETLAKRLFTGMVERVVALVSRVEGTYEFEVQPLREYFAARHLYDTAPYSPPGRESKGTLPDRFDALARDLFWQNVTRFYAGCYSKGELPSLVERIQELARSAEYRHTSYAHELAATLLSDWVFAQSPRAMREVTALLLDGVGLRIAAGSGVHKNREALVLPKQNGNEQLVEKCYDALTDDPASDYREMLLSVIGANCTQDEAWGRWWSEATELQGSERTRWMRYGLRLGLLWRLNQRELTELLSDSCDVAERLALVCRGGRSDLVEPDDIGLGKVLDYILAGESWGFFRPGRTATLVGAFAGILNPYIYCTAFDQVGPWPLSRVAGRFFGAGDVGKVFGDPNDGKKSATAARCADLVGLVGARWEVSVSEWTTQLGPWRDVVDGGRGLFGDRWAFGVLANIGAGIRAREERSERASALQDGNVSLVDRVRYARLRAGAARWWESQLELASGQQEMALALLVLLTWAGASVFDRLAELVDDRLSALEEEWWHRLCGALEVCATMDQRRRISVDFGRLGRAISDRMLVGLAMRTGDEAVVREFRDRVWSYDGDDWPTLALCQRVALGSAQGSEGTWREWLPVVARTYGKGVAVDGFMVYKFYRAVRSEALPEEVAREIVEQCDCYPAELVAWAERACRRKLAKGVVPVSTIAKREGWFG